ncbi:MAG: peptidoglycan-binding domain-containing protein [Candidatus Fimadaptatus sp.]|jgi:peptidoglycan hydrolase-like protein with peptidoglycan-binding domain
MKMKRLVSALLAASLLGCGAGALADGYRDSVDKAISAIEDEGERLDALLDMNEYIDGLIAEMSQSRYDVLERNDKGEAVEAMQERLAELGYYDERVDGKFDNDTVKSLKQFEKKNGLANDGVASAYDQAILFSSGAINSEGERAGGKADGAGSQDASEYEALDYAVYAEDTDEYEGHKVLLEGEIKQMMDGAVRVEVDGGVVYVDTSEADIEGITGGDSVTILAVLAGEYEYTNLAGKEKIIPAAKADSIEKND